HCAARASPQSGPAQRYVKESAWGMDHLIRIPALFPRIVRISCALPSQPEEILWFMSIRRLCLLILVCPLDDDDCLDSPHRELDSRRKRIADGLRPKPVNTKERLLVSRPA